MNRGAGLHPVRLFASCPTQRAIARELYQAICDLPIISPHGHTDPRWFADHYALFRGTPTRLWMDYVLTEVFGIEQPLFSVTAPDIFGQINERLASPDFNGYLRALRSRRAFFKAMGATSTDHGHPSARTAALSLRECEGLYQGALQGRLSAAEAELLRAQMLTEMALMSLDDGLVMQLHPGVYRNHNPQLFAGFGRDRGADIPLSGEFVNNLKPLLDLVGNDPQSTLFGKSASADLTYGDELNESKSWGAGASSAGISANWCKWIPSPITARMTPIAAVPLG